MAKKTRPISYWYPSLHSWWVSSLEMVDIFHHRLEAKDFASPEVHAEMITLFESLPYKKCGFQLSDEQVSVIRSCCKKIEEHVNWEIWSIRPKDNQLDSQYGICRVHKFVMRKFLKLMPYSVSFLPPRIGIQPEVKFDTPLAELPLNTMLIGGILRTHVQTSFAEERNKYGAWSGDLANDFFSQNGGEIRLSPDALELIEVMVSVLEKYRDELKRQRRALSRNIAAYNYVIYQVDKFIEEYLFVTLIENSVLH